MYVISMVYYNIILTNGVITSLLNLIGFISAFSNHAQVGFGISKSPKILKGFFYLSYCNKNVHVISVLKDVNNSTKALNYFYIIHVSISFKFLLNNTINLDDIVLMMKYLIRN